MIDYVKKDKKAMYDHNRTGEHRQRKAYLKKFRATHAYPVSCSYAIDALCYLFLSVIVKVVLCFRRTRRCQCLCSCGNQVMKIKEMLVIDCLFVCYYFVFYSHFYSCFVFLINVVNLV